MHKFRPVLSQVKLPQIEEEVTKFWKEKKIFEKSINERSADGSYTFVDGPPFVTGNPHYGSLLPSIAKDVIPRYQTMLGKRVRRVWGWDCHGLPIEEKVNQMFGIKSSALMEEKMGIEKYVEACRNYVQSASSEWRWYIDRIGRWVDLDNAYYTMNVDFMESVIWAFKQIYKKGLIYKGKRVSLFSTDTSTPVSNFEVAMDNDNYRDVEDLSVFVKFEIGSVPDFIKKSTKNKVYFVAWTTTPWTIPANFALAVNPEFKYVLVEYDDETFIVAKERVEHTFGSGKQNLVKIVAEIGGVDLEGLKYKPVYEYFINQTTSADFTVYLRDDVKNDEGTGVLHVAPAFGEVDFQMGQKHGITAIRDIDEEGKMTIDPWMGIYLRDASPLIAEHLEEEGNLLRSEVYTHRLPFYRGKNPLIYMAQEAYFIDIQKIKQKMLELNEDINWIPSHIKEGRFKYTLETSPDWCISRNRYWATIMPIWQSEDGDEIIIGSIEEMIEFTEQITKKEVDGKTKYFFDSVPMDLHRDICDKIILKKNGKEYRRIPEVLDCWMDSGSVPFAEYHYPFENEETFLKAKPADFIIEYVGQVRAWFNVLLRISTVLFEQTAFKNVICTGVLAGSDGRKMSKSFGNYPDPKMVLEKYGGDALRLYMMSSPVMHGDDMNFLEEGVAENYRFLLIFWNTYKFFVDYASLNKWVCEDTPTDIKDKLSILDKWILSKLTKLTLDLRKAYDSYDIVEATNLSKAFVVNDFSTWYIRRSRDKVSPNSKEKNITLSVMYGVLVTLTKLLAPLVPFITEEIFKNLVGEESVHLQNYPLGDEDLLDEELIIDMATLRKIVEVGLGKRKEANIKLRQPLAKATYSYTQKLNEELEEVMIAELNVKAIEYKKSSDKESDVELDTKITPKLAEEGEARELIRKIQQTRKELNLTLSDKTKIYAPGWPKDFEGLILKGSASISLEKSDEFKVVKVTNETKLDN